MDFLSQFLPIIIYFLLIIVIVVGIVLGIKLIITIDKIEKVVNDVNEKIEKVSPLFNTMGMISDKVSDALSTVVGAIENFVYKLFFKNKEEENEDDE